MPVTQKVTSNSQDSNPTDFFPPALAGIELTSLQKEQFQAVREKTQSQLKTLLSTKLSTYLKAPSDLVKALTSSLDQHALTENLTLSLLEIYDETELSESGKWISTIGKEFMLYIKKPLII